MKRHTTIISLTITILISVLLVASIFSYYDFVVHKHDYDMNETITIAAWNMQVFGEKKALDDFLMQEYHDVLKNFDIIFIEEIRDKNETSFWQLCSMFPGYGCLISSRSGRTSMKEQYGLIYRKSLDLTAIQLVDTFDYNPDIQDRFERPPFRADFSVGSYSFSVYDIHTKPNESTAEIKNLESLVYQQNDAGNIIVLGDMNADCSYYDRQKSNDFSTWHWIIGDDEDTTTGPSDCALDRIIMNDDAYNELADYGIYKNIDSIMSDHYLVWARIRTYDYDADVSLGEFMHRLNLS